MFTSVLPFLQFCCKGSCLAGGLSRKWWGCPKPSPNNHKDFSFVAVTPKFQRTYMSSNVARINFFLDEFKSSGKRAIYTYVIASQCSVTVQCLGTHWNLVHLEVPPCSTTVAVSWQSPMMKVQERRMTRPGDNFGIIYITKRSLFGMAKFFADAKIATEPTTLKNRVGGKRISIYNILCFVWYPWYESIF